MGPRVRALHARFLASFSAHPVAWVFAAALAVRLVQNLGHPPLAFATSDMGGYVRRAARVLDEPWSARDPWAAFFPPGTHLLLAAVQAVGGRAAWVVGVAWALLGAGVAAYAQAIAGRLLGDRPAARLAVGALLVGDVHQILLGSFVLSEIPASFALAAATFHLLRHLDEGRARDALGAGLAFAAAALIRPQALVSLALVGVALARARRLPRPAHAALLVAPLALALTLGSLRVRHHTGRLALVSTNGGFNLALGRCHPVGLSTRTRGSRFSLGAFEDLHRRERAGERLWPGLRPALGAELTIDGGVDDEPAARALAARCVEATGLPRQAAFSLLHVGLLWFWNLPFPTGGPASVAGALQAVLWLPLAALALARSARREEVRLALVTAHLAALVVTAAVFFGDARLRVPYDPFGIVAAAVVACAWLDRRRAPRVTEGHPPPASRGAEGPCDPPRSGGPA